MNWTVDSEYIKLKFQEGPISDGVNGCTIEDVIAVLHSRLAGFQVGTLACEENALAMRALDEVRVWLQVRRARRIKGGVEGTHEPL